MIGSDHLESQVPHGRPVFRPDDIPPQLRPDLPIWVVWGGVGRDGKPDKAPRSPRPGLANVKVNAGEWFTLEDCLAAVQANPERLFGVGRMMNAAEDGIVGIDLDHVMECDAGVEFLDEIRRAMPFAYVERSPSGTGVRLFAWAPAAVAEIKAKGRESVARHRYPVEGCGVEIYANGRGGRHLTITGDTIHRGDLEVDSSRAVLDLVASLEPKARPAAVQAPAHDSTATDADIARAMLPFLADARARDRGEWVKVGHACKAAGLTLADWLEFSRRGGDKFESDEKAAETWATFKPHTAKISWLVAKAKEDAGAARVKEALRELHRVKPSGPGWKHAKEHQREFHAEARGGDLAERKERAEAGRAAERAEIEATEIQCLREFVEDNRHGWRYVKAREQWIEFREGWWRYDVEGRLADLVRSTVEAKFPPNYQTIARANSIAAAARAPMHLEAGELDRDSSVIGVGPRGAERVVDLRNGEVRDARSYELVTRSTGVMPGPASDAWLRCLEDWTCGDAELARYLRRVAGYWLTGSVALHEFYLLHGGGGDGKSTFLESVAAAMGPYAGGVNVAAILAGEREAHPTSRAKLCGLRLAYSSELPKGSDWNESAVKAMTGGDRITARFVLKDEFDFTATHKLAVATNSLPRVREGGESWRRRVRVIPFRGKFERNPALPEILAHERAGILAWMIEGAREVLEMLARGKPIPMPAAVRQASADYLEAEDWFGQFLEDRCQVDPGAGNWFTSSEALIEEFAEWAPRAGISTQTAINSRTLASELPRRFPGLKPKQLATGDRCRGWTGIRLRRHGEEIPV